MRAVFGLRPSDGIQIVDLAARTSASRGDVVRVAVLSAIGATPAEIREVLASMRALRESFESTYGTRLRGRPVARRAIPSTWTLRLPRVWMARLREAHGGHVLPGPAAAISVRSALSDLPALERALRAALS